MAVLRQLNISGQMRLDVPHLRLVESAVAGDFDLAFGKMVSGQSPVVIKGFNIIMANSIGQPATNLRVTVADSSLIHFLASDSGSIFGVVAGTASELLAGTNSKVLGSWAPSASNYVGLDLVRATDAATVDDVKFRPAGQDADITVTVPLARTLQYRFIIQSAAFSTTSNVLPIAIVVLDAASNVVSITDARNTLWRLGSGGDSPAPAYKFPWVNRAENAVTSTSSAVDPFSGGDKQLDSFKDWADATMTRLWELGGGEFWYSATADRNVKLIRTATVPAGSNDNFKWTVGTDTLEWDGLAISFENSDVYYNTIAAGSVVMAANGDCLYIDLNRTSAAALVPVKSTLLALGSPTIPGVRHILAWRYNNLIYTLDRPGAVGTSMVGVATGPKASGATGTVLLLTASSTPLAPVVPVVDNNDSVTATGLSRTSAGGGSLGAGNLNIGAGAQDSTVKLGKATGTIDALGQLTGIYGVLVTQATAGGIGVESTGNGAGHGVKGTGGATSGWGVYGVGGAPNGYGLRGLADGNGSGVYGKGGDNNGVGVEGIGGATNGVGVAGLAFGSGQGVYGEGSGAAGSVAVEGFNAAGDNIGGKFTGSGTAVAVDVGAGHLKCTGADPASTVAYIDTLTPMNIPKAWALLTPTGAGAVTVTAGFNVTSAVVGDGAGGGTQTEMTVTWAQDFGSANYCIQVSVEQNGTAAMSAVIVSKAAGTCIVKAYDTGAAAMNLNTANAVIHVTAFGAN